MMPADFAAKVRDTIRAAAGLDASRPDATDDLAAMTARRWGIPPARRAASPWHRVPNRADKRANGHPGRTRAGHYIPRTSPRKAVH